MRIRSLVVAALAAASICCSGGPADGADANPVLTRVASGLDLPVALTASPDNSGRLFVTLQRGTVVIYDGKAIKPVPFLDLRGRVSCCGERGLLSVAFHPRYATNGYVFVDYTDNSGDTTISRFSVSRDNPDVADAESETVLLKIQQPYSNHNGGQLQFGPDGYLYIGMGDGGSGGDPDNRGQNLRDLLGKILRIDVDGAAPYAIPPTNPFVASPDAKREIWAYGVRNPWRFSFDLQTGDLYIADVGQNKWEEVDVQAAASRGGENYGWRLMEGSHCYNPATNCNDGSLVLPVVEYSHDFGCAVTGGYVYRGKSQRLSGTYIYGDYCSGTIWGLIRQSDGSWQNEILLQSGLTITSFGQDASGEVYVVDYSGAIYRLDDRSSRKRPARRE